MTVRFDAELSPKTSLVYFISEETTGIQWVNDDSISRSLGQSFLARKNALMDSLSFKAAGNIQPGASEASFTLTIYESAVAKELGTAISTQTGTYMNTSENPINGGWVTFDVEDVNLVAGKYYTCILSFNEAGVMRQSQVFQQSSGYGKGYLWMTTDEKLSSIVFHD